MSKKTNPVTKPNDHHEPHPEPKPDPAGADANVRVLGSRASLWLASRSPRRRDMLTNAGLMFGVIEGVIDDSGLVGGRVSPEAWVMSLAYLKATSGVERLHHHPDPGEPPRIVIGADTVCVLDGRVLGQPADADEARAMLASFRNREHTVTTGVALLCADTRRRLIFAETACASWADVTDDDIESYLATEQWRGKAGAYNLRERLDAGWPIRVTGDANAVMGLPMDRLLRELPRFCAQA